jgi:hypothetical protein
LTESLTGIVSPQPLPPLGVGSAILAPNLGIRDTSTTVGVKDFGGSRGLQAPENRSKGNGL